MAVEAAVAVELMHCLHFRLKSGKPSAKMGNKIMGLSRNLNLNGEC